MSNKSRINKAQWTNFWNGLGIYIKKPNRFLHNYSPSQDIRKLVKIGVNDTIINQVQSGFNSYKEPNLQFHRFVKFFRKDYETVKSWIGSTDVSLSFLKLFRKLHYKNFKAAKGELKELFLLYKLNEKGEGRGFEVKFSGRGSIERINSNIFSGLLSLKHQNASFSALKKFKVGSHTIIPIVKNSEGKNVYKFIRLSKQRGKVIVDISVDSPKELSLVKYKISDYFGSYLDVPETGGNFDKLLNFLKTGESQHYTLIGINYFDNLFKISVFPQHNRVQNIASYSPYKRKFTNSNPNEIGKIATIRVANKEITTKNQVFVNFYTFITEGIIGALTLSLDDRRLNFKERKKLREDFVSDFDLPLNKLIRFGNISEEEIYKTFLQNLPQRKRKVQLRSELSLNIYKSLFNHKLVSLEYESSDNSGFCFNTGCRLKYQRKLNQKICQNCKDPLFNDRKIIIPKIDEKKITEFVYNVCKSLGFSVEKVERRLISRKVYITEVRNDKKSACFLPVTKDLNDNQLEILKFRYPNIVLITSKDDIDILRQGNIEVVELYKLVQKLINNDNSFVKQLINKVSRNRLTFIRSVVDQSATRVTNDKFYKDKNSIAKNFGAEFFEADCAVILSYVFGNSIWLGASKRGSAFPDGITAFPLTLSKNGCFIWDTKFCQTGRIAFGSDAKNSKYIQDGKKNQTVKDNGGLKGFIFISNSAGPSNFRTKFGRLARGRVMKILFIESFQLKEIFDHFRDYETQISNNSHVKEVFIASMKKLIFSTTRARKGYLIKKDYLDNLLAKNVEKYTELGVPQVTTTP